LRRFIKVFIITFLVFSVSLFTSENNEKQKFKQKKKVKRAVAECVSLMAVSQTNYWLKYSNWIEDWQFKLNWEDQRRRILGFEGQSFDSNCFRTNWTHGLSGAMYYNIARANGFNIFESSVFGTLTSLYWEFVVEWREVISVNDNIFTSFGGVSIGESFFQLGSYFAGKKGIVNRVAEVITNPVLALNRWFDRKNEYSYYKPKKREMSFFIGNFFIMEDTKKPYKDRSQFIGFKSSLSYLPEIEKKGLYEEKIKGTILSEMGLKFEIKDKAIDEVSGSTRNMYFGKYKQNIREYQDNYIKGSSSLFSMISGFDFYQKKAVAKNDGCQQYMYIDDSVEVETPTNFADKLAIMNLTGAYSEITHYFGMGRVILTNSFTFDFAMVNAYALGKYSESDDISYTKATLYNYGYYYGFGYTINSRLDLFYHKIRTGIEYKYQRYNSIEGLDRFQEKIKDDFNIRDIKSIFGFHIGYNFNIIPLGLKLVVKRKYRRGIIKDYDFSKIETKVYVRLEMYL